MKLKEACPKCYSQSGITVVLEEEKGVYFCPKNATHKFKKNKEGFLEPSKDTPGF